MIGRFIRSRYARDLVAIILVVFALVLREELARSAHGFPPYVTFFPAIVLAALLGDVWTGILATGLAALLASFWVLEPIGHFSLGKPSDALGLVIFCLSGISVSVITELYHRNRKRLVAYQMEEAILNERKKVDQARQAAEDTLGSIGDAVLAVDSEARITFLNPVAAALTGWQPEEAQNRSIRDVLRMVDEQTGIDTERLVTRVLQQGIVEKLTNGAVLVTKDGREVAIENSAAPILDSEGKIIGVVLVFRDVTEKRQAQEEQAEKAALLDLAHDSIVVLDLDWRIHFWNRGAERMYGYSKQEALGQVSYELLSTVYQQPLSETQAELLRDGYWEGELTSADKNGNCITVASRWALQRGRNEHLTRVLAISSNITPRKRAEAALRESKSAFETLANLVPQLVWMCTPDGLNVYFNQRWVEYTGLTLEESQGTGWSSPFHPEDKAAAWAEWNHSTQTGDRFRIESRLRGADGKYRWFLMRAEPLRNAEGNVVRWFGTCTDIEDLKQAEHQLRALTARIQQVREEERTNVARDLHDQIGQILTTIKLDLTWMARRMTTLANDEVRARLAGAIELTNDGVRSVRKICSGLRPGVLDDLGLAAAIEWQLNEFASRTGIRCQLSLPPIELEVDRDQTSAIFRIFQEALTNVARHAEARSVHASLSEQDGNLLLVIEDDGQGFREAEVSGSLGLLGMKERAQACGGDVQVSSSPGNGTTVTVRVSHHVPCAEGKQYANFDRG